MITNPRLVKTKMLESKSTHTPQTQSTFHSPSNSRTMAFFNKELQKISEKTKLHPFNGEKQSHSATSSSHTFITNLDCNTNQIQQKYKIGKIHNRAKTHGVITQEFISESILQLYNEFERNYQTLEKAEKFISIPDINKKEFAIQAETQNQYEKIDDDILRLNDLSKKNRVKIIRFRFYYFRIKTKGRISPIQIVFNCPDRVQSSNIRLFISSRAEFPTKFNAEWTLQAKYTKIYADHNQLYFTKDFLYVTFYSDIDFDVTIDIIFGNPKSKPTPRPEIADEEVFDPRPATQRIIRKDKILLNLDMRPYLNKMSNFYSLKTEREQKQQNVLENKKLLDEEKHIDKVSKVLARESINQFREIEKIVKKRAEIARMFQTNWLSIFSLFDFCSEVKTKLEDIKRHKRIQAKGKLIVWQLKTAALMKVQAFGSTPKERTVFKSRLILQTYAKYIKKKSKLQAEEVVSKFIKKMLLYLTTLNKQQSLIKKVKTIQRKFRNLKLKKRMFRDRFWRYIKENISEIVYQLKRQKDVRNLFSDGKKPAIQIDLPVMQGLIDEYCEKARERWMNYINRTFREKNRVKVNIRLKKQKIQNVALNFTEPKLYDMPNEYELTQLIDQYAKIKKLY